MLTFLTMYVLRLYYPRWKEQWRLYFGKTRRGSYGRWASRKDWSEGYSWSYS